MASARQISGIELGGNDAVIRYLITGCNESDTALNTMLSEAPSIYKSMVRRDEDARVVEQPSVTDVGTGDTKGAWEGTVPYRASGQSSISGDFEPGDTFLIPSVGTQPIRIKNSLSTIQKVPADAFDHRGAIGVNHVDGSIEGADTLAQTASFSITHAVAAGEAGAYWGNVVGLTTRVNNAPFVAVDSDGVSTPSFEAGEVMLMGGRQVGRRFDGARNFELAFATSPNKTGLSFGSLTGINKRGFEHLWLSYENADESSKYGVRPLAAYVEQISEEGDFSLLGLPTP